MWLQFHTRNPLVHSPINPIVTKRATRLATPLTSVYTYPAIISLAFTVFTAFIAFPILDLPLLGLSLTAPIFFLISLEVFFRPPEAWLERYRRWVRWGLLVWTGILLSVVGTIFWSRGENFSFISLLYLVRYAYWLLVFVVTCYFVSRLRLGQRTVSILALGILALALLRWFEAVFLGNIGFDSIPTFLTQNNYGFQFSMFVPMALVWLVSGRSRLWGIAAMLVIWGAVAINASRSAWITAVVGYLLFLWMYLRSGQGRSRGMVAVMLLLGLFFFAVVVSPQRVMTPLNERLATLERLENDKSYATRQLMIQKGWHLFMENPFFGVGIGRFRQTEAPLELPQILRGVRNRNYNAISSHNSYIQWLAETGVVGSIPYATMLVFLCIVGYRSVMRFARRGEIWAICVYTSAVCMSVHLWSISGITNTSVWFIYGLLGAIIILASEPYKPDQVAENQTQLIKT
jgi:O-antigen ligase